MIRTLKDVLHDQIHESCIPLKILAVKLGISYSYLANAANPDLEDFHFQLKHLIPLIENTNDLQVLDYIESAVGRVAIELPHIEDPKLIHTELCRTIKEFGDMTQAAGRAMEDNKISVSEAKRIEKETMELISQAMLFLKSVQDAAK